MHESKSVCEQNEGFPKLATPRQLHLRRVVRRILRPSLVVHLLRTAARLRRRGKSCLPEQEPSRTMGMRNRLVLHAFIGSVLVILPSAFLFCFPAFQLDHLSPRVAAIVKQTHAALREHSAAIRHLVGREMQMQWTPMIEFHRDVRVELAYSSASPRSSIARINLSKNQKASVVERSSFS